MSKRRAARHSAAIWPCEPRDPRPAKEIRTRPVGAEAKEAADELAAAAAVAAATSAAALSLLAVSQTEPMTPTVVVPASRAAQKSSFFLGVARTPSESAMATTLM